MINMWWLINVMNNGEWLILMVQNNGFIHNNHQHTQNNKKTRNFHRHSLPPVISLYIYIAWDMQPTNWFAKNALADGWRRWSDTIRRNLGVHIPQDVHIRESGHRWPLVTTIQKPACIWNLPEMFCSVLVALASIWGCTELRVSYAPA